MKVDLLLALQKQIIVDDHSARFARLSRHHSSQIYLPLFVCTYYYTHDRGLYTILHNLHPPLPRQEIKQKIKRKKVEEEEGKLRHIQRKNEKELLLFPPAYKLLYSYLGYYYCCCCYCCRLLYFLYRFWFLKKEKLWRPLEMLLCACKFYK